MRIGSISQVPVEALVARAVKQLGGGKLTGVRFPLAKMIGRHRSLGVPFKAFHASKATLASILTASQTAIAEHQDLRHLLGASPFREDAITVGIALLKEKGFDHENIIRGLIPLAAALWKQDADNPRLEFMGIVLRVATAELTDPCARGKILRMATADITDLTAQGKVLGMATADITDSSARGKVLRTATADIADSSAREEVLIIATADITNPTARGEVLSTAGAPPASDAVTKVLDRVFA